jgi:predicted oxidoreductase
MDTTNKIFISIDDQVIELQGEALDVFLEQRAKDQAESAVMQAEQDAKAAAKESALTKLQALGLSEAEAKQIVGI